MNISYLPAKQETLPSRKRVAAYARVSSGKDASLHSLSAQVSFYSSLIQRNNEWEYAGVYADSFISEEEDDFKYIKENYPNIKIYPTVHVKMRFVDRHNDEKILALGQKAAYFTGSNNFVNMVEGGGMYGFDAIVKLCDLMVDAFLNEKDMKKLIQFKGLGCENYETNCK